MKFQKSPIKSKFSQGVSPWFWVKNGHFSQWLFLGKSSQKASFFYVLDRKECFLDKKSKVLKKSKKSNFSKGVSPCFFAKNDHFFHWWYLRQSSQKRSSFEILDRKEWFLDKKSQVLCFSSKIAIFLIGCFWANLARKNIFLYSG